MGLPIRVIIATLVRGAVVLRTYNKRSDIRPLLLWGYALKVGPSYNG